MAAQFLHDTDLLRLAAKVNTARASGSLPTGGLLFYKGQYFQMLIDGESTVNYTIVAEQDDVVFTAKVNLVSGLGAFALGTPLKVNGYFIQAFGDMAGAGGGTELPDGTTPGQALIWDGSSWVAGETVLPELPPGTTAGYVLTWNGTTWVAQPVPAELPGTATDGNVLTWNGSEWVAEAVPSELPATATAGYVLTWNGATWVAQAVPTELPATSTTGYVLTWNGSAWVGQAAGGSSLPSGTVTGQTIQWDGDSWEPGITPADAAVWGENADLGANLPAVIVDTASGYPIGALVIDATGQASGGLFIADGATPLLQLTVSAAGGLSVQGPSGSGAFSLAPSSTTINAPSVTNVALNSTVVRLTGASSTLIDVVAGSLQPFTDNAVSLGASGKRWTQLWAATTTINTSDADYKTAPQAIPDAVLDAIGDVDIVQYKMLDAIAAKGDENARLHVGVIAQQVIAAFQAHGVDATDYGIVCYDTWPAEDAVLDKDGNEIIPARAAGGMWSVRYDELQMLELARLRRALSSN